MSNGIASHEDKSRHISSTTSDKDDAQAEAGATPDVSKQAELTSQDLPEQWQVIRKLQCSFPPEAFNTVMLNLMRNPNITASHLFRADVYFEREHISDDELAKAASHLKPGFRPRPLRLPGWELERICVRDLVPRNTRLDKHLVQTCHFMVRQHDDVQEHLIVYTPHVDTPEEMPFYHPRVAQLSFRHEWRPEASPARGSITLSYRLFDGTQLDDRLQRTGIKLLDTIHKHGQGQLTGYEKRVHHDTIIPQKTYQDTYTRLKNKYGRHLVENWVEVTDSSKHVFEDIGIAAFLVELWKVMYSDAFPGFVDIGCGNGVLTFLLISEGYKGYGFDARRRKTWSIFPDNVQACLEQRLLVPSVFSVAQQEDFHNGTFDAGTFIVSNHADELTAWTPLLAYLNQGSFIAIPCCSHDLAGARFRAPSVVKGKSEARLPQQEKGKSEARLPQQENMVAQAAETGSLKRTLVQKKMASAYSTLCSYVESLAAAVGYTVEREVLRIPSTRNHSIIGRWAGHDTNEERKALVCKLVEEELGQSLDFISSEWIERAKKLMQKPGSGH